MLYLPGGIGIFTFFMVSDIFTNFLLVKYFPIILQMQGLLQQIVLLLESRPKERQQTKLLCKLQEQTLVNN